MYTSITSIHIHLKGLFLAVFTVFLFFPCGFIFFSGIPDFSLVISFYCEIRWNLFSLSTFQPIAILMDICTGYRNSYIGLYLPLFAQSLKRRGRLGWGWGVHYTNITGEYKTIGFPKGSLANGYKTIKAGKRLNYWQFGEIATICSNKNEFRCFSSKMFQFPCPHG